MPTSRRARGSRRRGTTLDERIPAYIEKIAKRDPFSGGVVTGDVVTALDPDWLLSWTVNRQPHFKKQGVPEADIPEPAAVRHLLKKWIKDTEIAELLKEYGLMS